MNKYCSYSEMVKVISLVRNYKTLKKVWQDFPVYIMSHPITVLMDFWCCYIAVYFAMAA
jgi:hypothetical protein